MKNKIKNMSMLLWIYNVLMFMVTPFLLWRTRTRYGGESRIKSRIGEYAGLSSLPRVDNLPVVWICAASVGESLAVLPLARTIAEQHNVFVLITTHTASSAYLLAKHLKDEIHIKHQFTPLDAPHSRRRFFNFWKPSALIFVESELWPGFLNEARNRKIPTAVVSARLSESSCRRWKHWGPGILRNMLQDTVILAQDESNQKRFESILLRKVPLGGNLKYDASQKPYIEPRLLKIMRDSLEDTFVFLATNIHVGEEDVILRACEDVRKKLDKPLLTILLPRHIKEGARALTKALKDKAPTAKVMQRSLAPHTPPSQGVDYYVADTLGEVSLFCALADVVLEGGSFVDVGGHSPFNAAILSRPILVGPHASNFKDIYDMLIKSKSAIRVKDSQDLARAIFAWQNTSLRTTYAQNAYTSITTLNGALKETFTALEDLLTFLDQRPSKDVREYSPQ